MGKSLIIKGAAFKDAIAFKGYNEKKNGMDISKVYKSVWADDGLRKIRYVRIPDVSTITVEGFIIYNVTSENKIVYVASRTKKDVTSIKTQEYYDSKLKYIKQFTVAPGRNILFLDSPITINQDDTIIGITYESLQDTVKASPFIAFDLDAANKGTYGDISFKENDAYIGKYNMGCNLDILLA